MLRVFIASLALWCLLLGVTTPDLRAQDASALQGQTSGAIQPILQEQSGLIQESSRRTIQPAIDAIAGSGLDQAQQVLEAWQAKDMWLRLTDGVYVRAERIDRETYRLFDLDTGADLGEFAADDLDQIKPNSGIRSLIAVALVKFQLSDPNPDNRRAALLSLERNPNADCRWNAIRMPMRLTLCARPSPTSPTRIFWPRSSVWNGCSPWPMTAIPRPASPQSTKCPRKSASMCVPRSTRS